MKMLTFLELLSLEPLFMNRICYVLLNTRQNYISILFFLCTCLPFVNTCYKYSEPSTPYIKCFRVFSHIRLLIFANIETLSQAGSYIKR